MSGHDAELILIAGGLLAAGIGGALLADRVRIPGLLLFLALGMLAGSEGIGGIAFDDVELARTLGTIALVLILFEGGLTAGWAEIRPVLGTAASLATLGTGITACVAGVAAHWIFGISVLEGLIVGSAIAATDSAAIFAVLRRSTLEKRLARSLEGESGMNDPVALLLVIGFIEWIQDPGFGLTEMVVLLVLKLAIGAGVGLALGRVAVIVLDRVRLPTDGIYPVATIAIAGLAFGLAEVAHGSGFLAAYLTALALGSAHIPARRTVVAFHEGVGWVAQIGLFILLGLLVFPSSLDEVALESLALSAVLILIARPLAAFLATAFAPLDLRERAMLGWAGLRGATPIWLATFPVVAGVGAGEQIFSIVFFVVVTSTLVQGASFEPLANRLGLTTDEPALPKRLLESGRIRRLGGEVLAYRLRPGRAAGPPRAGPRPAPGGARQRHRPRGQGDPAARLDRAARGGRAACARPRRAARGGRGAHPALARRADRQAAAEAAAAAWRAPGLLGAPRARRRRRSLGARARRRRSRGRRAAQPTRQSQRPGRPRRRPLLGGHRRRRRRRRAPGVGALVRGARRAQRRRPRRARLVAGGDRGPYAPRGARRLRRLPLRRRSQRRLRPDRRPRRRRSRRRRARRRRRRPSRRWRCRCRRRPRSSPRRRASARRATFSGEPGMKDWPPQPGLTVMQRTRSARPPSSASASAGVPGLIAMPARQPSSRIAARVRLACGVASSWKVIESAPAPANASMWRSGSAIIM